MGVLNMNHEKNKLNEKSALQPLITTPMFGSAEAFLSHTDISVKVIAPLSLTAAFRNNKLWGYNPRVSEIKCFPLSFPFLKRSGAF